MIGFLAVFLFDTLSLLVQVHLLGKYTYIIYIYIDYESWVVPAGVPSALADILGAELGPIL